VPDNTPLYSTLDALDCIGLFGRSAVYGQPIAILPDISATFFDAGHILGSASILLDVQDGERRRSLLFSGDIGNAGRPLLRAPQTPLAAEIVVMETTYGDRLHRPFDASVEELYEAINATLHRGGNILIPTFALERTQDMLFCLHKGIEQSRLPPALTVFLDSPMAISATEIFKRHPEAYRESAAGLFDSGGDPFGMPGLRFARERAESMAIDRITGGAVIMAGSGMCTGGRIRYHLRNNLSRSEASVVFVGFAAGKTLARRIIDGARTVRILGEDIAVRAHVHTINGFSAHADQAELLQWHDAIQGKQATFLVHGEESVMKLFSAKLHSGLTELPVHGQQFDL
jgi:metallo-beta-lactamase family protein